MRQELIVCQELKKWFNSYNINCWLNEGKGKFIVKGSRKKPDLIIYSKRINQYIAIEVKTGNVSKNIYDASKIIDYYKDYYLNEVKYFIEEEEIKISSFAIATLYSMFGHLFQKEYNKPFHYTEVANDNWKKVNKKRFLEPIWEYPQTHNYLRHIWSTWRLTIRERKQMPGLGIIVCNSLNYEQKPHPFQIDNPILFDQQWEIYPNKSQWKVRQKWL